MRGDRQGLTRRSAIGGAIGAAAAAAITDARAASASARPRSRIPRPGTFLWGTATSGHQIEGNNVNSDFWLLENVTPTLFRERSGDACDSYHRYAEDIALAAGLGFNAHRFSIEWARIEPEMGRFSNAELDHYERVLETCHKHGLAPMVSLNHWSVPRWFAARGGFEEADSVQLFARFAEKAATRLGGLMTAATTFNEANITRLARVLFKIDSPRIKAVMDAMFAAAAKASGTDRFASVLLANLEKAEANQVAAHHAAVKAVKAARSGLPIGLTLAMQEIEGVGAGHRAAAVEEALYGPWLDAAGSGDFVGVQTYTRIRVGKDGPVEVPEGAEKTAAGFEFYPRALGATIRYAAQRIRKPIYVTENGIATNDDSRRIAYIDTAVRELRKAKAEGIDVRGYFHWSLLDNFEWTFGFAQRYGLIAVEPTTFKRTPKPSALHLGRIVRSGRG